MSSRVGSIKSRILYQSNQSTPPKFALSLAEHVVKLKSRTHRGSDAEEGSLAVAFPIGTILETVQVRRVEPERGLVVEVEPGLLGFVHVCWERLYQFSTQN
jgi:rRNA biogenesis protein RRP5